MKLPVLPVVRWDVIVSQGRNAFGVSLASALEAHALADEQHALGRVCDVFPVEIDTIETATASLDEFFKGAK